ncbi:DEAD/DEAH box helicase family protein [Cohnella kolymensis]|uniref:DEAD/DEAH box helicase family protein n=1 Tax=Cohnella kolymensis TaxID=1590652 RepID=UPI000B0567F9|nr:DEAD/DEAH box helicase family protein [Cohnella kolymensis]
MIYQRAVGFFSSSALIEISYGITELLKNGGKIQLIASPRLQKEDIDAIEKGYEERSAIIERAIIQSFSEPKNYFEEQRLNLLATLVAQGRLDIKIAFIEDKSGIGMYHEKVGLIHDADGNVVAFTGSMNETSTAFSHNYETIDVFCSWTEDSERVSTKQSAFNALWNDYEPRMKTIEFPRLAREKLQSYKNDQLDLNIDIQERRTEYVIATSPSGPQVPEGVDLHSYQLEAIDQWAKQDFRGIFDMATGTGKTFTGLGAICRLFKACKNELAVIIVCPYQHLVEQWVEDIVKFNMKPIIGYSASTQKDWKKRLKETTIAFNLGVKKHFCFITTNATFSSEYVRQQINMMDGNVVLVVDEAHNFGAANLSKTMNPKIPYRLALSATLERHGDEDGTEKLFQYFGEKCIEYTLEMAIKEEKLTPYYYHPVVVYLCDEELEEYKKLSRELIKHCSKSASGKLVIDEYGKMILIKRARIVAAARYKISKLEEFIEPYKEDKHILVYCGAATIRDLGYEEGVADEAEIRQIDAVSDLLGNKMNIRISQFTSAESAQVREQLKEEFSEGKHIQALVAIRCLDEGVNIPSIKLAFILASSTNPKEYVQRRGRVLRKSIGKTHAVIYDFITLPRPLDQVKNLPTDETRIDISLVKKEITRMKDFASIAENPSEADKLINMIEESYDLLTIGGDEYV